ncbi:MAG: glycosyltransferase, partial [Phycisphaerales bacterium]
MASMRVCFVSRETQPGAGGGIGTAVRLMSRHLVRAGHEVTVLTGPRRDDAMEFEPGVRVEHLDLRAGRAAIRAWGGFNMVWAVAVLDHLRSLPAFDHIEFPDYHAEGYFALRAKRTLGDFAATTLAVRLHAPTALCRVHDQAHGLDYETALTEHMELAGLNDADLLVGATRAAIGMVVDLARARGLWRERVPWDRREVVVPLPVEVPTAPPMPPSATRTVLFFGRLQRLKGAREFVACARRVRGLLTPGEDVRFVLIGGDTLTGRGGKSMEAELRTLIGSDHAHIVIRPPLPREQLFGEILNAEVVCLPSRLETFSFAAVEAMALGRPVVALRAGSLPEIVEDGVSGVLVPPDDPRALAEAVLALLRDGELRARLGAGARQRAAVVADPARFVGGFERVASARPEPPKARAVAPSLRASVVIPHYNLDSTLPETLASVAAQTCRDFEVIIVDDGSTSPGAVELMRRIEETPSEFVPGVRVTVLRKPNGGLSSARNAGFGAAAAPWVLMLDADDLIEPRTLGLMLDIAERDDGLAYVSTLVRQFERVKGDRDDGWAPLGIDPDLQPGLNLGGCSCSLVRREAWREVEGFDEWMTTYEDWEFWCRFAAAGMKGSIIPEFLFWYRVRPDSMFRAAGA